MDWNVTMLLMNSVLLVLSGLLWKQAPCWMQRLVVVLLVVAFVFLVFGYAMRVTGVLELPYIGKWWHVTTFGFLIEHLAVVIYVFRIVLQGGLERGPITRRF